MEASWRLLRQSAEPFVRKVLLSRQSKGSQNQRPLQNAEQQSLKKHLRETTWDEGVIHEFMDRPHTKQVAYDLAGGLGTLLLFASPQDISEKGAAVASRVAALLEWLAPSRPFRVFLWFRHDPRKIGADEWPSRRSVNGGWTTVGSSEICIYRAEEWERVLLHEMIHALEWDWKMPETPQPCWTTDAGKYYPALFEAWTELLAEWFWCGWMSVEFSQSDLWIHQRAWQKYQALQILARQRTKRIWEENTSVFAYYILKTILSEFMPFLWLHQNGDTAQEREKLLCKIIGPGLDMLETQARNIQPVRMDLRMTIPPQTIPRSKEHH